MLFDSPLVGATESLGVDNLCLAVLSVPRLLVLVFAAALRAARQHFSREPGAAKPGRQARGDAVRVGGTGRGALAFFSGEEKRR